MTINGLSYLISAQAITMFFIIITYESRLHKLKNKTDELKRKIEALDGFSRGIHGSLLRTNEMMKDLNRIKANKP